MGTGGGADFLGGTGAGAGVEVGGGADFLAGAGAGRASGLGPGAGVGAESRARVFCSALRFF